LQPLIVGDTSCLSPSVNTESEAEKVVDYVRQRCLKGLANCFVTVPMHQLGRISSDDSAQSMAYV
jgi:hypothetical protein